MSRCASSTNDHFSKKHNHLDIQVHLARICNIQRKNVFDRILPNIDKHDVRQKSQFLFLRKIENGVSVVNFTLYYNTTRAVPAVKDVACPHYLPDTSNSKTMHTSTILPNCVHKFSSFFHLVNVRDFP